MNPIRIIFLLGLVIASCQNKSDSKVKVAESLPYYDEATFTPHWLSRDDSALDSFHQISPFELINQEGQILTQKDFDGKIYITDFFFTTCPGICPKMTANMSSLQKEFADDDDILLLSHSVTPERDTVSVLKAYAENHGVDSSKWHLVTGKQSEIYKLGRQDYFVEEDLGLEKSEDEFLHTENFVLVDKNRHIRGIYNGLNRASLERLITDVRTLQEETK